MRDYRFALRAYPPSYRSEHGTELVDIANELADDRWSLRQSSSLLAGGLRTRARLATHGSGHEAWASGVRMGLLLWLLLSAASGFAYSSGSSLRSSNFLLVLGLLQLPAIFALTISTKWTSAVVVTLTRGGVLLAVWAFSDVELLNGAYGIATVASAVLASGLAWWLALATDGRRAARPTTVGWLLLAAFVLGIPPIHQVVVPLYLIPAYLLFLAGVVVSRHDPRIAAAATTYALLLAPLLIPSLLGRGSDGWDYWGPLVTSAAVLVALVAASVTGVRRLLQA